MTPAPPDLNRTVRNHRFHSCHVGRQRCRMERSDVAGHQGSGECAPEGHSEGMHVFLRHLVSNASERGCALGRTTHSPAAGFHTGSDLSKEIKHLEETGVIPRISECRPECRPAAASSSAWRSAWIMCTVRCTVAGTADGRRSRCYARPGRRADGNTGSRQIFGLAGELSFVVDAIVAG